MVTQLDKQQQNENTLYTQFDVQIGFKHKKWHLFVTGRNGRVIPIF